MEAWKHGSGWQYNEDIDNVDTYLYTYLYEDELKEGYSEYCENDGDEIREYD